MTAKFEIFKSTANQNYYFRLKAGNGEIILGSEGYTTRANCKGGISSVKANSSADSNYERKKAMNGQFYFNLRSTHNGRVIGTSEMYVSTQGRDNGIESVKRNAPTADVVDLTEAVYG